MIDNMLIRIFFKLLRFGPMTVLSREKDIKVVGKCPTHCEFDSKHAIFFSY